MQQAFYTFSKKQEQIKNTNLLYIPIESICK